MANEAAITGKIIAKVITQRRGMPVYDANPSVPDSKEITKPRRTKIGDSHKGLVIDTASGEVLGSGGAIVYQWEDVDSNRFVKLYLDGIRQTCGLSKTGLALFEHIYRQMQESPGKDEVKLSIHTSGMTKDRFYRALKELLEREFLFHSPFEGIFFVNIRFMFNGDRLAFIKGYKLKEKDKPDKEKSNQLELLPSADTDEPVSYSVLQVYEVQ